MDHFPDPDPIFNEPIMDQLMDQFLMDQNQTQALLSDYRRQIQNKDKENEKLSREISQLKHSHDLLEQAKNHHIEIIEGLTRDKEKLEREIAELKTENFQRIEDLKHDKKKMEKLYDDLAAVLKKATFGQNLSINWHNCTITRSEIDSKAISQGKIEMQAEGDAKMIKELEIKLKTIKIILTEKIQNDLQEGEYRLPEKGTNCPMCRRLIPINFGESKHISPHLLIRDECPKTLIIKEPTGTHGRFIP